MIATFNCSYEGAFGRKEDKKRLYHSLTSPKCFTGMKRRKCGSGARPYIKRMSSKQIRQSERSEKIAIILIKRKKEIPSFIIILVDEKRKSCIIYATNGCSLYYYNLRVEMDNVVLSKLQQSLQ